MASGPYDIEHNIAEAPVRSSRLPDLSTFFTNLSQVQTEGTSTAPHNNANALPTPPDMAAVYRTLHDAYDMMRQSSDGGNEFLDWMVEQLGAEVETPPRQVQGVSDEWLADLPRVPKKSLKKSDVCPICANPFLEDEYPLVVRLPCHKTHVFDLACVEPWLKLHATCPMDRKELNKKKPPPVAPKQEGSGEADGDDDDPEWDDMYA